MTNTSNVSESKFPNVYQLDVLYYTRKKPDKIIVGEQDLGKEVTRLMKDGMVQLVHVRRYHG